MVEVKKWTILCQHHLETLYSCPLHQLSSQSFRFRNGLLVWCQLLEGDKLHQICKPRIRFWKLHSHRPLHKFCWTKTWGSLRGDIVLWSWQNLGLPYHWDHFSTWISFCLVDKNWNHETKELPSWKLSPHPFSPSRAPLPTFRDHAQGRCSVFQWKWTKEVDNRSHRDGRHLGINSSIPPQPVHHHYKTWSTSVMDPTSYPGHLSRGDCQNCHRRISLQKTSHNCLVGFRASIYSLPCAPFPVEHLLQAWLNRSCCLASKVLGTPDIPRTCHLPMGYSSVLKQTESNLRQFPCHARTGPSAQGHR